MQHRMFADIDRRTALTSNSKSRGCDRNHSTGGQRVRSNNVEVGERVDSLWIVTSGLKAGDRVVSEGTAKVREGMTVNPTEDKSDTEVQ